MGTKKELTKLKGPDALQERAIEFLSTMKKHRSKWIMGGVAVAIAAVFFVGSHFWQKKQDRARRVELAKIDFQLQDYRQNWEEKKENLRVEIKTLKEQKKAGKTDPKAASDSKSRDQKSKEGEELQAKIDSKEKKWAAMKPDYSAFTKQYLNFFESNQSIEGSRSGWSAAQFLVESQEYSQAREVLARVLKNTDGVDFYQLQVREIYIEVLEELAMVDEALGEVEILLEKGGDSYLSRALMIKARLLMQNKREVEAVSVLNKIVNEHNASKEFRKAAGFLSLLNRKEHNSMNAVDKKDGK